MKLPNDCVPLICGLLCGLASPSPIEFGLACGRLAADLLAADLLVY